MVSHAGIAAMRHPPKRQRDYCACCDESILVEDKTLVNYCSDCCPEDDFEDDENRFSAAMQANAIRIMEDGIGD